ncbi:Gfo/Idh/MocA family protein [Propionivibrio dicarboxylicus]|uniref:Predicted dehydrogenase n=1 Tax=Propionivibrio dicarboxylicus TaxID=83767 RepID=A0A1G8HU28_9RHOO|nr:Gfo/Idh/MocA family oxidoreductase [Propionivibrio dicarboxylicus]SDI10139.1 Predicted dehydrogenase [Propionivibrio dicarboxylicus]
MSKVRIAVAGAGLIGHRHIEEIRKSEACALASIVDPCPPARFAEAARGAGVRIYAALEDMLASDKPDGVVLATPNQMHADQAMVCIGAGIPTLVEKPLAHTLSAGIRLCEAAEAAKVKILVGHHRLHSPILHQATKVIESGLLGQIVAVMGSAVFYKPDSEGYYDGPNAWRREPGGGPILLNLIHEIGNLRALVGEIVAVQAFSSNAARRFNVEDTAVINLKFDNGALGSFLLSDTAACARSWEQTSQENKDYPSYPDEDCYTVIGTFGSLSIPTMRLKYYSRADDRSWYKPFKCGALEVQRKDPLAEQIDHFAAVIRGECEPLVSARDGLQNLRVVDAVLEAAAKGCTIGTAT